MLNQLHARWREHRLLALEFRAQEEALVELSDPSIHVEKGEVDALEPSYGQFASFAMAV